METLSAYLCTTLTTLKQWWRSHRHHPSSLAFATQCCRPFGRQTRRVHPTRLNRRFRKTNMWTTTSRRHLPLKRRHPSTRISLILLRHHLRHRLLRHRRRRRAQPETCRLLSRCSCNNSSSRMNSCSNAVTVNPNPNSFLWFLWVFFPFLFLVSFFLFMDPLLNGVSTVLRLGHTWFGFIFGQDLC